MYNTVTKRVAFIFLFKVLVITIFIFTGYYFLFLKPKTEMPQKIVDTKNILSSYRNSLTENKISFIELSKLNPNSASFEYEKNELVEIIKASIENGKQTSENPNIIPQVNSKLSERYPGLLEETNEVYLDQEHLLKQVFATNSFEEGVEIMRSDKSVQILTKQTNLILEYDYWIKMIGDKN
jgi:hypothetical protein